MAIKDNFFILTGGPGSGKTSLISELKCRGYECVTEVGRQIIQNQVDQGGDVLPWKDCGAYSKLMFERSLADYKQMNNVTAISFFDRGIPDTYGYERLEGIPPNPDLLHAIQQYRYNRSVFILPPWQEIFENDTERKQDFDKAVATYQVMFSVYSELAYKLIIVPKITIKERVDFILSTVLGITSNSK